jgi:hypothetical protein
MTDVNVNVKKGKEISFEYDFKATCTKGDCSGWKTNGVYFIETDNKGIHFLDLLVNIKSPNNLE